MRWYSVTKTEIDQESHGSCATESEHDPGDWCSEGHGAAWMDVLYAFPYRIAEVVAVLERQPCGTRKGRARG